jgi:hypothetical protein
METESEGHLTFLGSDNYWRPDGSLGHKVYRKPTRTNLYLNAKFHHHPSNKQAVLSALKHRARALCDEDSLQAEMVFLRDVFKQNGYNDRQIQSPQPPSALTATGQRPQLSRLPVLCRDYIQPNKLNASPVSAPGSTLGRRAVSSTSD